ncbi:MAG TPA: hypothetical protein VKG92_03775 [Flavobacteriales bacterium]|nr:hypothetical protein [Flavobacteriales bacterium]
MNTACSLVAALVLCLLDSACPAQDTTSTATPTSDSARSWTLTPSLLTILYRDTIALWNPAFNADRNNLHLEARYQWEDWNTASVWAGRWFGFGDGLHVDMAPMVGGVFGNTNGIAPGLLVEAEWKSLSFYSSSEYLIDPKDPNNNFTYTWSELAVDLDHLLVGIVAQRTRTWDTSLDLQRGLLLMREQGSFLFGMYLFNIGWTDPTVAFTFSYEFETHHPQVPTQTP